ncbi:MAG TPA: hypothetical protein VK139_05655, partial [Microbacteriaceae bacterium]|nr:hypothetical protein [Microbacteriaceae bacterium]
GRDAENPPLPRTDGSQFVILHIVALVPSLMNMNGDAENARVLAYRAQRAGLDVELHWLDDVSRLPERVDLVVLGSGSDSELAAARTALLPITDRIRAWATEKTVVLAVGTGWELLSWGVERENGDIIEGFGVFAGRSVSAPTRVVGEIVVESPWGELIGFENHARDYVGAEKASIGPVLAGSGNGIVQPSGRKHEGIVMGTAIGTHLHGPVCAKNPGFADALLTLAAEHAGERYEPSAELERIDAWAADARSRTRSALELDEPSSTTR